MSGMDPGKEFKVGIEESDRIGADWSSATARRLTIRALRDAITLPDILRMITGGGSMQWRDVDPQLVERFQTCRLERPESAVELLKTREAVRALTGRMRRVPESRERDARSARRSHDGRPAEQVRWADGRGGGHGAHGRDRVQVAGRDGRRRRGHPHIVRQRLVLVLQPRVTTRGS